ncbi:DinB family protein [soil metagenome]
MSDPLVETWEINNRINLYLLEALKPGNLEVELKPKGRTVGTLFSHMHNVRLMWLKVAGPALLAQVRKIEVEEELSTNLLTESLNASGNAITELITTSLANEGRVKGFKPHVTAFVGYLISHESHHRGQVAMALRIAGATLDKKVSFGMWEWGSR